MSYCIVGHHCSFKANRTINGWWSMFIWCLGVLQLVCHDGHEGSGFKVLLEGCTIFLDHRGGCCQCPISSEPIAMMGWISLWEDGEGFGWYSRSLDPCWFGLWLESWGHWLLWILNSVGGPVIKKWHQQPHFVSQEGTWSWSHSQPSFQSILLGVWTGLVDLGSVAMLHGQWRSWNVSPPDTLVI